MEEGRRKRAFVVSHSGLDDDDSDGGGGGGGIYAEMTSATALLRNPPLPTPDHSAEEDDDVQANLAVEIDGKPCDCVYISPTAVDTHKLPTPAGWYVEVPDEEGVGFSVRHAVFAPTYPVISKVFVDGQQACRWELKDSSPRLDHGFWCERQGSVMAHVQPFKLQQAQFKEDADSDNDRDDDDDDVNGLAVEGDVGTITLRVWRAVPRPSSSAHDSFSRDNPASFVRHDVDPDKKTSFLDRVVAADAPHATSRRWVRCAYLRDRQLLELTLHYRTRRFFDTLQGHIDSRGGTLDVSMVEEMSSSIAGSTSISEGGGRLEIKQEQAEDVLSALAGFVLRLARVEKMPNAALQPLYSELARRGINTVHKLRSLTPVQWRETVHAIGMPASLARSAMKLASPPPKSPSAAHVVIVIDD